MENEKSKSAEFRFYGELNDFLRPGFRGQTLFVGFLDRGTVKDFIELIGVPHPEIEFILINGEPAGFDRILADGDRVAVYPEFTTLDPDIPLRLKPPLPDPLRFVLDVHLGKLAKYLRMLGFDTFYRNNLDDPELARISHDESRILLTRDIKLLERGNVVHGCWVRNTSPKLQVFEAVKRFDLIPKSKPFTRCLDCNSGFIPITKEDALPSLPPDTRTYYHEFQYCPGCKKVFWKGSHYERMQKMFEGWKGKG